MVCGSQWHKIDQRWFPFNKKTWMLYTAHVYELLKGTTCSFSLTWKHGRESQNNGTATYFYGPFFYLTPPTAERWCIRSRPCPLTLSTLLFLSSHFLSLGPNKQCIVWEQLKCQINCFRDLILLWKKKKALPAFFFCKSAFPMVVCYWPEPLLNVCRAVNSKRLCCVYSIPSRKRLHVEQW